MSAAFRFDRAAGTRMAGCLPAVRTLLPLIVLSGLSACSASAGGDFFPLEAGHRWRYQVTTQIETQSPEQETLELQSLGKDDIPGQEGSAWHRRSASGLDYWLRQDDSGIFRVASKTDVQAEAVADKPARYVLKQPFAVGTTWQASTAPYLLRRRAEFPPEIRHTHPEVPMSYRIEALDQSVSTPAGAFKGCIKVQGSGTLRLFADPVNGWKDQPLITLEWYCPGVGLVRVERQEPANSAFLLGGTLTLELLEWD